MGLIDEQTPNVLLENRMSVNLDEQYKRKNPTKLLITKCQENKTI